MKARNRLEIIISLIICLVLSNACSKKAEDSGWEAKIEIVDGIKVITNPEKPKYGKFEFELEVDLTLGDMNDENYLFPFPVTLNVDDEGNLYVCDGGNRRVQKYDKSGTYVRTIGRYGQGPGEYMFPSRLFLDDVGNPCVGDARSLVYFDKDGIFQEKILLKGFYSYLISGPHKTFLGLTQPSARTEGGAKLSLIQVGENGEPLRTIAEFPISYSKNLREVVTHWYTHHLAFAKRTADSFYYGFSKEYKVNVADRDGHTIFVFAKEEKPRSITGEEKELTKKNGVFSWTGAGQFEKAIVFPDQRPYFTRFISDDSGHLYVIRSKSILERANEIISVDVFSEEGIYLYQMTWTFFPALIKNGFLYEVRENNETGEIKLFRHKIKNWDQIKEGN